MTEKFIKPMEPVLVARPFDDPRFLYQIKWDGIRIIAYLSPQGLVLRTKNGHFRTDRYPELWGLKQCFTGESVIFDGEVIVLGPEGVPSFHRILQRDGQKKLTPELMRINPVVYVVFDLLFCNNQFLTGLSLLERQRLLEKHLCPGGNIYLCENYPEGKELFQIMQEKGMEGIVAKEKNGLYYCGEKNRTWQKVKCFRKLKAILGGVVVRSDNGGIKALLVGLRDDSFNEQRERQGQRERQEHQGSQEQRERQEQKEGPEQKKGPPLEAPLRYVGKVFSGLKAQDLAQIKQLIAGFGEEQTPFINPPVPEKGTRLIGLPPYLALNLQYLEWSENGVLRNPVFLGFTED